MENQIENKPIRILHMIGGLDIGGSQIFVMNLYRKIDRNKVQFDFVIDHPKERFLEEEIKKLGGKIYEMPSFKGKNIKEIKSAWTCFLKAHPEYKVLHSHIRSYASLYIPIAKKLGLKTVIHSHSISNGSGISAVVKKILQFPLRFQADYFMACSLEAGKWLFGKRVCKKSNFNVIKNAIDAQKFIYSEQERNNVRQELGIEKNAFVIGFLARVTEPKNPFFVIDIFSQVVSKIPDAVLLFVGDGNLLNDVKKKINEKNLQNRVILTGVRDDAPRMLSAMDFYLFPSLWEGLGISLIEAQASGLRCLCSENVPKSAIVTDLAEALSLNKGDKEWANKVVNFSKGYKRENMYNEIKNAGFDIAENVLFMENFYLGILD